MAMDTTKLHAIKRPAMGTGGRGNTHEHAEGGCALGHRLHKKHGGTHA